MSAAENNVVAFPGEADELPLIPEGVYRLAVQTLQDRAKVRRDVLELEFAVTDYGEHFGKKLVRYYSVRASEKRRNFTARPRSDFAREYAQRIRATPAVRYCVAGDPRETHHRGSRWNYDDRPPPKAAARSRPLQRGSRVAEQRGRVKIFSPQLCSPLLTLKPGYEPSRLRLRGRFRFRVCSLDESGGSASNCT